MRREDEVLASFAVEAMCLAGVGWGTQEKEAALLEKKASKEMASAARQVHENVKRTAELDKQESEVGSLLRALCVSRGPLEFRLFWIGSSILAPLHC